VEFDGMAGTTETTLLPKILVNSVPKSGTNLLMQLVLGIPHMRKKEIPPGGVYISNFDCLQELQNGEMTYGHLLYRPEFPDQLERWSIKQLFISRDPRDVTVSMAHFIVDKFPQHPLYPYLTEHLNTHEERLLALIEGVRHWKYRYPSVYEECGDVYEWMDVPGVCCATFEDLVRDRESRDRTITKIVDFLWEDLRGIGLEKHEVIRRMKGNIDPRASWTFRKGSIGSWREEFREEHKAAFKERTGDFLIRLGYEEDMNW
jgi:sulfotransferase 6B1